MVSLHLLGLQRQGALFWTPALMVHTGVRRGRLATGQNRQCSHSDELRPGGRCDIIILVHHWDVAKASAPIAQVGSPRPAETTHDVAPWTENSGSSAPRISAASLAEERPRATEEQALAWRRIDPCSKRGSSSGGKNLALSISVSEPLFFHL